MEKILLTPSGSARQAESATVSFGSPSVTSNGRSASPPLTEPDHGEAGSGPGHPIWSSCPSLPLVNGGGLSNSEVSEEA
jgi:hypothetical protein